MIAIRARHVASRGSLAFTVLGLWACTDPVREDRIDALGPEAPAVRAGPLHRPGQPCLACHDGNDGDTRAFSVAGTVYAFADAETPAPNVVVELTDVAGRVFRTGTNCAGNFFVTPEDFAPRYPLWVTIASGDLRVEMDSPIQRDGSCASCHAEPVGPRGAGRVYLYDLPRTLPETGCP